MLSRIAVRLATPLMRRSVAAFSTANNRSQLVQAAQSSIDAEIESFTEDLYDFNAELSSLKATTPVVDAEGVVTFSYKTESHEVVVKFNQEFEYREDGNDSEFESSYSQAEHEEENQEEPESDVENDAFHTFTMTFTNLKDSSALKLQGTVLFNGDCEIDSLYPIQNGKELREISTADLSDDSVNSIFDLLDSMGVDNTLGKIIVGYSRYLRFQNHIAALKAINGFIGQIKLN